MRNTSNILRHAEKRCVAQGARLTRKRKLILSGLLKSEKAMSAYDLANFCNAEYGEKMTAMSVYRMLSFLQEQNLVHKLELANKYVACSHICCSHAHEISQFLICTECQHVEEIGIKESAIAGLTRNMEKAGFDFVNPQLEMNGVCESCSSASPG